MTAVMFSLFKQMKEDDRKRYINAGVVYQTNPQPQYPDIHATAQQYPVNV